MPRQPESFRIFHPCTPSVLTTSIPMLTYNPQKKRHQRKEPKNLYINGGRPQGLLLSTGFLGGGGLVGVNFDYLNSGRERKE